MIPPDVLCLLTAKTELTIPGNEKTVGVVLLG
jgi:hypothetical protein